MNKHENFFRIIAIFVSIILVVCLYSFLYIEIPTKKLKPADGKYVSDVPIGGHFILTDQDGKAFDSNQLNGEYSLVYFGFTYCPDICPAALSIISASMEILDKYRIKVQPVFITIDPKRDTSVTLKNFLHHFHSNFIGLTGTEKEIRQVADQFKVYYAIDANRSGHDDYLLNHSSFIYFMDNNGKYKTHFDLNSKPLDIANYIKSANL